MWDRIDRREYQRLIGEYFVYYKIKDSSGSYNLTRTKNISKGGMLLSVNEPFEKGKSMALIIKGPFVLGAAIETTGVVIESRKIDRGSIYETRIKFSNINAKFLDKLDEFIKRNSKGR
ncbi:MAG: PilZ domain-containing protein [Candidatus Omnitrophota bacterium]